MNRSEFLCKTCNSIFRKSEHGLNYKHGDIKLFKEFQICVTCNRIKDLKKEEKRKKDRYERVRINLGLFSSKSCDLCLDSFLDYLPMGKGTRIPKFSSLVFPYPYNKKASVCRFCLTRRISKLYIPLIYLFYSEEEHLYKIGESTSVKQRIINIKATRKEKDWNILSFICFPKSSRGQRQKVEKGLKEYFKEYDLGHEYFDLRFLHNPIKDFERETIRLISEI